MKIWDKIVILRPNEKNKGTIRVNDSKEAARVLLTSWPASQGKSYRRAVLSCSADIDGRVPQDMAQWAFIVAVMEAAIPYEIIDRLDSEIGAVCWELLGDEATVLTVVGPVVSDVPLPIFRWPKRQKVRERDLAGEPAVLNS